MLDWKKNVRNIVPYVPGEQPQVKDIIKLNTNENPYPPSPLVKEVIEGFDSDLLRKYPDPNSKQLIKALSSVYDVPEDCIFTGVGSDDVLGMAFLTFFNSDKPVLFPDITYSFYDVWCELFNIKYEQKPLKDDFTIDTDDYLVENGGIVIANPNAPTSIAMPLSEIEKIISSNPSSVVIVDEAYIDFGGNTVLPLIDKYDNLLVVRTFSKSRSMAGIRIGYCFGNKELIAALNAVKNSYNSYTMNMVTIAAGAASLYDRDYFDVQVSKIVATREKYAGILKELGFDVADSSTNFLFASHNTVRAQVIFEALRKKNIFVRYWNKPRIDNRLRITVGTDYEMESLITALKEIISQN